MSVKQMVNRLQNTSKYKPDAEAVLIRDLLEFNNTNWKLSSKEEWINSCNTKLFEIQDIVHKFSQEYNVKIGLVIYKDPEKLTHCEMAVTDIVIHENKITKNRYGKTGEIT